MLCPAEKVRRFEDRSPDCAALSDSDYSGSSDSECCEQRPSSLSLRSQTEDDQSSSSDLLPPAAAKLNIADRCPRTLALSYYDRDDATLQRKWEHQDWLDSNYSSREQRIFETVLAEEDTVLELNPFPYQTPPGVTHHTLWSVHDMSEPQIEAFVEAWIRLNLPDARQWNYDANESRSIDIFHIHVYIDAGRPEDRSLRGALVDKDNR